MKQKIIYRSIIFWNLMAFSLLSFMFFYGQEAIILKKSALDLKLFKAFVSDKVYLVALTIITTISLWKLNRFSKYLLVLLVSVITFNSIWNLFIVFDKFLILTLFLYILIAYYFYVLLDLEIGKAYLNPMHTKDQLFEPMLVKIKCILNQEGGSSTTGYLTNWDKSTCHMVLENKLSDYSGIFNIRISFDGHEFIQSGKIASIGYNNSIGIRFIDKSEESKFTWTEFIQLVNDLGFNVEQMK